MRAQLLQLHAQGLQQLHPKILLGLIRVGSFDIRLDPSRRPGTGRLPLQQAVVAM